jgi:hypothetical protein
MSALIVQTTREYVHADLNEIRQHHMKVKLKPEATVEDIIWELSNLFGKAATIQ